VSENKKQRRERVDIGTKKILMGGHRRMEEL
jgi:hypothetical protein